MIDADLVCVSFGTTYRVMLAAGLFKSRERKPSKKGKGFHPPNGSHGPWYIDITSNKVEALFNSLIVAPDRYSRFVVV